MWRSRRTRPGRYGAVEFSCSLAVRCVSKCSCLVVRCSPVSQVDSQERDYKRYGGLSHLFGLADHGGMSGHHFCHNGFYISTIKHPVQKRREAFSGILWLEIKPRSQSPGDDRRNSSVRLKARGEMFLKVPNLQRGIRMSHMKFLD